MLATCSRSSKLPILLVACEATASGSSSAWMPPPSSRTRISRAPPSSISTSMRRGTGIEAVLDQFLDHRGRALDDLAGGDLVDEFGGKQADDSHPPTLTANRAGIDKARDRARMRRQLVGMVSTAPARTVSLLMPVGALQRADADAVLARDAAQALATADPVQVAHVGVRTAPPSDRPAPCCRHPAGWRQASRRCGAPPRRRTRCPAAASTRNNCVTPPITAAASCFWCAGSRSLRSSAGLLMKAVSTRIDGTSGERSTTKLARST